MHVILSDKILRSYFLNDKNLTKKTQEVKKKLKGEIKEIKRNDLEAKILDINVEMQVLHEGIKELV